MKYVEYLYLAVSMMIFITLVKEFEHLETVHKVAFTVAILLTSFMFAFRRGQRQSYDRYMEEEMRKLEEEVDEEVID